MTCYGPKFPILTPKNPVSVFHDQRQLVLPVPLPQRGSYGRNCRPTTHCDLDCPQLGSVWRASVAGKGRFSA